MLHMRIVVRIRNNFTYAYNCVQMYAYEKHLLRIRMCDICTLTKAIRIVKSYAHDRNKTKQRRLKLEMDLSKEAGGRVHMAVKDKKKIV